MRFASGLVWATVGATQDRLNPWSGLQFEGLHSSKTGIIEQDGDGRSTTGRWKANVQFTVGKAMGNVHEQVSNYDGGCALGVAAHSHRLHQVCWVLRSLRANAAMCPFGIHELRSTPPKSCFLGGMLNSTPCEAEVPGLTAISYCSKLTFYRCDVVANARIRTHK